VLHGRHPSTFDWLVAGPPAKIVVPATDYARIVRRELRRRLRWFRTLGRVTVIPHGVEVPADLDKPPRAAGAALQVVAVSRLDDDMKRPFDLVRIAARAAEHGVDMRLTIAGSGPAEEKMRAAAGSNVTFAGAVPHDQIGELLRKSDVLLSTSESEAFGLSIAEALAYGCAVVAADIAGTVQEMVTPETGIRVPVGDIDAFTGALAQLAAADVRAKGRAGRAMVSRRFSSARMGSDYASLVRSLGRRARANRTWLVREPLLESPSQLTLPPLRRRLGWRGR
jgi:glycosyltransferase involved in cell wall biosynthesis